MSGPDSTGREEAGRRPIRSFVIRGGRLTDGQARALEQHWPRYGIECPPKGERLDYQVLFGRSAPVIAEIGFGNGGATWRMAQDYPDQDFIGIEVHRPGVGHLLLALEQNDVSNVRVACEDAVEFMNEAIPPASLAGVRIFFPDPWPKKRHHKRRIVQPAFIACLADSMAAGGVLHLATDWAPYAEHMVEVISANPSFRNLAENGDFSDRPAWRPETRYELRGKRLGHEVFDLLYEKVG